MDQTTLSAVERTVVGKPVKTLRATGTIPAVIYGHGVENKNISVDVRQFEKVLTKAGESTIVDLTLGSESPVKVLIQDVQRDPLRSEVIHVDFRQINMNEALEVQVALQFVGEAPAVKALGAILVKNMDEVTVRCLPKDLVHEITVDISNITQFHDSIALKDLVLPPGLEVIGNEDDLLIIANEPISEAELAELDTAVTADVASVKVETDEKKKAREEAKTDKE